MASGELHGAKFRNHLKGVRGIEPWDFPSTRDRDSYSTDAAPATRVPACPALAGVRLTSRLHLALDSSIKIMVDLAPPLKWRLSATGGEAAERAAA